MTIKTIVYVPAIHSKQISSSPTYDTPYLIALLMCIVTRINYIFFPGGKEKKKKKKKKKKKEKEEKELTFFSPKIFYTEPI